MGKNLKEHPQSEVTVSQANKKFKKQTDFPPEMNCRIVWLNCQKVKKMDFELLEINFDGYITTGVIENREHIKDPEIFLARCYPLIKDFLSDVFVKINFEIASDFIVKKNDEEKLLNIFFHTKAKRLFRYNSFKKFFKKNATDFFF